MAFGVNRISKQAENSHLQNLEDNQSGCSITLDAEDLFNRYFGVPLATIDDVYSISTLGKMNIKLWMSKKERIVLHSAELEAHPGAKETQFSKLCSNQDISIDDSRPSNRSMWIQQFFRIFKKENYGFVFLTNFPAVKFPNSKTILRVHDPFGTHSKALRELLKKDVWKAKVARTLRTYAFTKSLSRYTIVASSRFTAKQFSRIYGIPEDGIKVIPCGFKTYEFETIMKLRLESISNDPYYLMICGMRGNKRPDIVVNEWALHAHRLPKLIIVGKISNEVLSPLALNLMNSGSLVLMDFADEESLLLLKINANAMIFASEYEGFGRPVIEAIVCGVPSIANELEVFQEIGFSFVDFFSLDDSRTLLPLFEKYAERVNVERSRALVEFAQSYSYLHIGKMWGELLDNYDN